MEKKGKIVFFFNFRKLNVQLKEIAFAFLENIHDKVELAYGELNEIKI